MIKSIERVPYKYFSETYIAQVEYTTSAGNVFQTAEFEITATDKTNIHISTHELKIRGTTYHVSAHYNPQTGEFSNPPYISKMEVFDYKKSMHVAPTYRRMIMAILHRLAGEVLDSLPELLGDAEEQDAARQIESLNKQIKAAKENLANLQAQLGAQVDRLWNLQEKK